MASSAVRNPLFLWAQRDSIVYLTVQIDTVAEFELTKTSLHVKGNYSDEETVYEATVEFYADVKTEYRKIGSDRHLELVITKETKGWWPRLLKSTAKHPWIKVDFNKWRDEDEEVDFDMQGGDYDFKNFMAGNSGGEVPNLDGFDYDNDDDEEDDAGDMPDLEDAEEKNLDKNEESSETDNSDKKSTDVVEEVVKENK